MFFTKRCPSGGTEYVSFELFLGILRGPGEGRGGAPGTVPLQNPEVTSRKACLRNADFLTLRAEKPGKSFLGLFWDFGARGVETPVYGDSNRNVSCEGSC